jgi:hypothetical protein
MPPIVINAGIALPSKRGSGEPVAPAPDFRFTSIPIIVTFEALQFDTDPIIELFP